MMKKRKTGLKKEMSFLYFGIFLVCLVVFLLFPMADTANAGTENTARYKYYTSIEVENGSSLWDIAMQYMTEEYESPEEYIEEVKRINHLTSDRIYKGAYLCIPYYSSQYQ